MILFKVLKGYSFLLLCVSRLEGNNNDGRWFGDWIKRMCVCDKYILDIIKIEVLIVEILVK